MGGGHSNPGENYENSLIAIQLNVTKTFVDNNYMYIEISEFNDLCIIKKALI